ncbi:MAG: F0F1 ATP synthase subunit alpha [Chloroflexota bacterium]|nr:F0F1 ATP synthase subunit alpha [Chloroflexota bacterium]
MNEPAKSSPQKLGEPEGRALSPLHTGDLLDLIAQLGEEQRYQLHQVELAHSLETGYHLSALRGLIDQYRYRLSAQSVGSVTQVGDGVAIVSGLRGVMVDELVLFPDGTFGLALDLDHNYVGCVLLGTDENVYAGDIVKGTGRVIDVPVGKPLLGRVVNALGQPVDNLGPLDASEKIVRRPIDYRAPSFIQRTPVSEPLQTGIKAIDSVIPLGRGQRELIIGDRQIGKTAIAVDAVINQRAQDVICVYACIGQKMSNVAQIVETFREHGAMEYTIVVVASAEEPPSVAYLAPYAACAMAETFMYAGRDVLIVYDDLTKHAIAYRQLSLLLQRPAGREAYPGDIFYLHSRLLERSACLSAAYGGGSMTALPIIETQAGNIAAYIPTNLISITDGQIYLTTQLFNQNVRPAIDVGLSVSRVGGAAQNEAMRAVSRHLVLDIAQFLELQIFSRFGTELDRATREQLARGERVRAILTQPQYEPMPVAHQVVVIYAAGQGYLDDVEIEQVHRFETLLLNFLQRQCSGLLAEFSIGHWNPHLEADLQSALARFKEYVWRR